MKLSNVRLNDQLLPKPQECRMSYDAINLPYPADHPYLSHIPQKDLLSNFDSPDDPQRGNEAKRNPPLHPTGETQKRQRYVPYGDSYLLQDCIKRDEQKVL